MSWLNGLLSIKHLAHKCWFPFFTFLLPQIRTLKDGNALGAGCVSKGEDEEVLVLNDLDLWLFIELSLGSEKVSN